MASSNNFDFPSPDKPQPTPPNARPPLPPIQPPPLPPIRPPPLPPIRPPPRPPVPPVPPVPPSPPSNNTTAIVIVFVSFGGLLFLAFLAVALCCFIKKKKKKQVQETDFVRVDERLKVKEATVPGPRGPQAVVLEIEDDVHVDKVIKKDEKVGQGLHAKSAEGNLASGLDVKESSPSCSNHPQLDHKSFLE